MIKTTKRTEQRKNIRRFVQQGARLINLDGSVLAPCLMVDISEAGARLKVEEAIPLPQEFILLLSHDGRLHRMCSIIWRTRNIVGVKFLSSPPAEEKKD